jgi:valyl-tRNA synthetase
MGRFLQLLHPYMPHVTEELSARMGYVAAGEFLMGKVLPTEPLLALVHVERIDEAMKIAEEVYESAARIRNLKAEYKMGSRKDIRFIVKQPVAWTHAESKILALLAGAGEIVLETSYEAPKGTPASITPAGEVYMPLEGLIDVEAERIRITKEIEKTEIEVKKAEGKLGNASFVDRAPPEVVEQEKQRLADWKTKLAQLGEMLAALG